MALEKAHVHEKVDHRSLEAQEIERIPQIHLGADVNAMMKRGIVTERGERWLAISSANEQIASLKRELEKQNELELERQKQKEKEIELELD